MPNRQNLIENKIIEIDSANFQNLCDAYLLLRDSDIISFNRIGTQYGKQKTTKGTPDTFYRLTNGSLRYVEHTTTGEKGIVAKIKKDIDKCLEHINENNLSKEITKIIICFNSRLDVKNNNNIYKYAKSKNIELELLGLDELALAICYKYHVLSRNILGIPLDTGQILSLDDFIKEYNNKGNNLSTPLDNNFFHREKELTDIKNRLVKTDAIILTGSAGVGKTKLALQAINDFRLSNPSYNGFVISQKGVDLFEDLKINIKSDENYILLIDDANRQESNLQQILGIFKESRTGNIKLIITVRNYAIDFIKSSFNTLKTETLDIQKFSDSEIVAIIESKPFEIKNSEFQQKIVALADGNSRLAIMAAKLALQKQIQFLYGDIYSLYDDYFQTFINDINIFDDKATLKILGLVSFFSPINNDNKLFITELLKKFDIDDYKFREVVNELESKELIETQYNVIRVSEQVMATYFFYKVFLKDDLLSFKTLMLNYYSRDFLNKFSDSIIPSNNLFYYTNKPILNKLNLILDEYFDSISNDSEKISEFYSLFWFYKQEAFLAMIYESIRKLPDANNPVYSAKYKTNDFVWKKDSTLTDISKFFVSNSFSFIQALELSFEYCHKKPDALPELVKNIIDKIAFDRKDILINFFRQRELINLFKKKIKDGNLHYIIAFIEISKSFLNYNFQSFNGYKNTVHYSKYVLPNIDVIKEIRSDIWDLLFSLYEFFPNEVFKVVCSFGSGFNEDVGELSKFDLKILYPFLSKILDKSNFEHVCFVQNKYSWVYKETKSDINYNNLRLNIINEEYKCFEVLDFNSHRKKQYYEFKDSNEFELLKIQELKDSFIFKNTKEFQIIFKTINHIIKIGHHESWSITKCMDIILEENFKVNNSIGFNFLKSILINNQSEPRYLSNSFKTIVNSNKGNAIKLLQILKSYKYHNSLSWQLEYFSFLPSEFIEKQTEKELLKTIKSINTDISIPLDCFEKFNAINENILADILKIVVEKNDSSRFKISLPFNFFENYTSKLKDFISLLERAYLQNESFKNNYIDRDKEGLKTLISINPSFLKTYINQSFFNKSHNFNDSSFKFIWGLEDDLIKSSFDIIINSDSYYGIGEHKLNVFFNQLNAEQVKKAENLILDYISNYPNNIIIINVMFDVIRNRMAYFFEKAYCYFLSLNPDEIFFQKIKWNGNGGKVYSGDVIHGDIAAKEWNQILEITKNIQDNIMLLPIISYIKKQISYSLKYSEGERKMKYIDSRL